jgi:hypothetical protein
LFSFLSSSTPFGIDFSLSVSHHNRTEPQRFAPDEYAVRWIQACFFRAVLSILQVLHFIWFGYIAKILYIAVTSNGVQGDIRSDNSDNEESRPKSPEKEQFKKQDSKSSKKKQ